MLAKVFVLFGIGRPPALGVAREEAMHHRVGVAANGRGEMRVILEHKAVVPDVVHAVAGFHHGTQRHHLHHVFLLAALHVGEQAVEALAHFRLAAVGAHFQAEAGHEGREFLKLFGVGHVMYAVGQRLGFLAFRHDAYHLRHAAVGKEHELLDEFVGIFRHLHVSAYGMPFLVNLEAHLGAVETYGAVLEPLLAQEFGKAVERHEFFGILAFEGRTLGQGLGVLAGQGEVFFGGGAVALEDCLHLFVGEAAVGLDDRVCQVPREHLAARVHLKDGGISELFLIGAQRADEVAEPLGQHRYGAVHEIDARGTFLRFAVYDVTFLHIVRHVGDMHAHFPRAVGKFA